MSRPSDPKKLAVWRERFERFSSCGLAIARFCSEERASVASFYHWRKKLGHKNRRRRVTDEGGVFQQVAVVPSASAVCIELPCGTRIEVDAEHLDAVRAVIAEVARVDRGTEATRVDGCAQVRIAYRTGVSTKTRPTRGRAWPSSRRDTTSGARIGRWSQKVAVIR